MSKVVVIAPHPDDAELVLGGSMHKWANQKREVLIVAFCASEYVNGAGDTVSYATRMKEFHRAADSLCVQCECLGFPDNKLNEVSLVDLISRVEGIVLAEEPDVIFMPAPSFNQDHRALHHACMAAFRPTNKAAINCTIFQYQYQFAAWGGPSEGQTGAMYEVLSDADVEAKVQALMCYQSQVQPNDEGPMAPSSVRAWARMHGAVCGAHYAEKFTLLRSKNL